jgi:hypothetical protein
MLRRGGSSEGLRLGYQLRVQLSAIRASCQQIDALAGHVAASPR